MDPEEAIVGQLGLILTQLRFTRRALEDVERSTARYGNFTFAAALASGARFGAPPMFDGALKVYVVNINDLAPGGSIGEFFQALLGGVGRLFGGFFGGLIGGTISGVALPVMLGQVAAIASTVERIVSRIWPGGQAPTPETPTTPEPESTSSTTAMLPEITEAVRALTGLFQSASSGPERATATSNLPQTAAGQRWLAMLQAAEGVLQGISRVLNGVILIIPLLIGTFVMIINRIADIRLAIIEMLQFALRNVFLLRGVALVTIFDTVAAAARLGASILSILGSAVTTMLRSIFSIVGTLLGAALEIVRFVSQGLQDTINAVLPWLIDVIGAILTRLGNSFVFRVVVHVVQMLPNLIPPLFRLIKGDALPDSEVQGLAAAARTAQGITAVTPGPATPDTPLPTLDLAQTLAPPSRISAVTDEVARASTTVTGELRNVFGAASGALTGIAQQMNTAAETGEQGFTRSLDRRLGTVRERSQSLADALSAAQQAPRPQTGLERIATAYESWLSGGGLDSLLQNITQHFQQTPTTGAASARSIPGQIVSEAAADLARATVAIEAVTIELEPPPPAPAASGPTSALAPGSVRVEELVEAVMEHLHDLDVRGFRPGQGLPFAAT
ncbi:MAG: hypothetical protein JOZ51_08505 [Chloroflexi bacterium]|nr:hypothetical protein [Chloroflexota bacterium]